MLTPRRSRLTRREGRPHCRNPFAEAAASSSSPSVSADAAAAEGGGPAFASAAAVESALAHLKANVYESIYDHYKRFHLAKQYYLDLRDDIGCIEEALCNAENYSSVWNNFSRTVIEAEAGGRRENVTYDGKKLAGMRTTLSVMDTVAKLHNHLQNFDSLMETGEFTAAASSAEEMNELLQILKARDGVCDPEVSGILRDQCVKKRAAVKHRLQEIAVSVVTFSASANVREMTVLLAINAFEKNSGNPPVLLEDILTALDTLGALEDKLKLVASQAAEHILLPLLRHGDPARFTTWGTNLQTKCYVTLPPRSGITRQRPQEADQILDEEEAFRRTLELSRFLCSSMFGRGGRKVADAGNKFAVMFGRTWWPAAWAVLKTEALDHAARVANPPLSLDATEKLLEAGREFEREMISIGMMPCESDDVSVFLASRALRFTQRRRTELLAMARDVLTSADENTVEVTDATERGGLNIAKEEKGGVGTDSFSSGKAGKPGVEGKEGVEDGGGENGIRLATCHITVQTQTLVEMAYQTLMEISGSDDQKAIELFYCARDLFDLFRAVVPVHRARELENSLTSSVLFYNDCTYIVHHLITMGYQFKPRLLPPLNQTATMVDMIPAFRRLGQGCFRAQMIRQRDLLLEALRSADGFGNTDSDDRFDKVERAIGRCTYQLTEISNKWKVRIRRPSLLLYSISIFFSRSSESDLQLILPLELYLKSLGILLGSALEAVIGEVLKLECTRAEELHQLRYLCGMFSHTACTGGWFCISKMASGSGGTAAGMRKIVQKFPVAKYCSAWAKFEACCELLEVSAEEFADRRRGALKEHFLDAELDRLFKVLHPSKAKMKSQRVPVG